MAKEMSTYFMVAAVTTACALLVLIGDSGAVSMFLPVPPQQIDQTAKTKAMQVAQRLLTGWREGKFQPLPEDFTVEMISGFPPQDQQAAYNNLKALFGEFHSLEFVEAVTSPMLPGHVLFRFRGKFSATAADPEVRVMMSAEKKVAGFWVRHWMDEVR